MKRVFSLSFVVLLILAVFAPSAFADWSWCEDDPMVKIVTPGGNVVNVHVTTLGDADTLGTKAVSAALKQANISYTTSSKGGGQSTGVTLTILIPSAEDSFATRAIVSSLPYGMGEIYGKDSGTSGKEMTVRFNLNVP